jgi:hypothetical protein
MSHLLVKIQHGAGQYFVCIPQRRNEKVNELGEERRSDTNKFFLIEWPPCTYMSEKRESETDK